MRAIPPSLQTLLLAILLMLASLACEDEEAFPGASRNSGQAGAPSSSGSSGTSGAAGTFVEPAPPVPPAPPVLTPCPERWTEKTLPSGVIACEPGPLPDWTCPPGWLPKPVLEGTPQQYNICEPPPLPETCPEGTMPVLGQTTCQPIGDPCPAGDFPEGLPTDKPILYVKAGATGGDGSKEKPLATVGEAVQKAGKGTVVAIGKGLYPEAITVGAGKDVTLWGACVNEVKLQGPPGLYPEATVVAEGVIENGSKLSLKNLTVTGERAGVFYMQASGALEGVVLKENFHTAMVIDASKVDLRAVVVKETKSEPEGKKFGNGLICRKGAQVKAERALFDRNRSAGVIVSQEGTSLTLIDAVVRHTQGQESDQQFGQGLNCQKGAKVTVERAFFDNNRGSSLFIAGSKTSLTLIDAVVQRTQSQEKLFGHGLDCLGGAEVVVKRTMFDQNREVGLLVIEEGTLLTLTDAVVRDTQSQELTKTGGQGLQCNGGAQVKVERTLFDHNREIGVSAIQSGTSLKLMDTVIHDTQSRENKKIFGQGFQCNDGAQVQMERVFLNHNRHVGVIAAGSGTSLILTDTVIQDTESQENTKAGGAGLNAQGGAEVKMERCLFDRNREIGVLASDMGSSLAMRDIVVQNTQSQETTKTAGFGFQCNGGSQVKMERVLFDHNRTVGVTAALPGTSLIMTDVWIRDTQDQESNKIGGIGLVCWEKSQVKMERAVLEYNRANGISASQPGTSLTLIDAVVRDTQSQESDKAFGRGLECSGGAKVTVERAIFERNRDIGILASDPDTVLTLSNVKIQNTLADESAGEYGVGISLASGASLNLTHSLLRSNKVAAILLQSKSQASLSSVWLADTEKGNFTPVDENGFFLQQPIQGVGDGLVVLDGSSVIVTDLLSSGMSRAGLLFVGGTGTLSSTTSTGNVYGLVLRGSSQPTYDATCSFAGNETPILPDGDLPVPNVPLPVPDPANLIKP